MKSNKTPEYLWPRLLRFKLFKNLSDETRLKIVLLLRASGELCVCELCGTLENLSPKYPAISPCYGKVDCLLTAARANGSTTGFQRICPPGRQLSLEQAYLSQKEDISLLAGRIARNSATTGGRAVCL
jgi:ArsR family transcriptional regulator